MTLHEWIYALVKEVCYDREYIYPSFIRHFGQLMQDIYFKGRTQSSGVYEIPGMKSGRVAELEWRLERCMDLVRLNTVRIRCTIRVMDSGVVENSQTYCFETSAGTQVPESLNADTQ